MPLRLRLVLDSAAGPRPPGLPPGTQLWIGGAAVGGTLDPAFRGGAEGPALRCMLSDVEDGVGARDSSEDGARPNAPAGHAAPASGALPSSDLVQINPGDRRAPSGAGALLIVSMDVAPEVEAEFNAWYDTEHLPALLQVPGVICGRRFKAEAGSPRYVAVYHLQSRATYAAEPGWLAADQTAWIKRLRRFQRDRRYYMFRPDPDA